MCEERVCFRCEELIAEAERIEVWGGLVGKKFLRVDLHESCNASLAGRMGFFCGADGEERWVCGAMTEAARATRDKIEG